MSVLNNFRLVVVNPIYPVNVGAIARLCANFDVRDVVIVEPSCRIDHPDAVMYAKGEASQYLRGFRTVSSLSEALADCDFSVAFARKDNRPPAYGSSLKSAVFANVFSSAHRVALVFGREDNGLNNEELSQCAVTISLRTAETMPSMNLSHSIAIVLSEAFNLALEHGAQAPQPSMQPEAVDSPAASSEFEVLTTHLRTLMLDAEINSGGNPDRLLEHVVPALRRAHLTTREIGFYRALFSKVQSALHRFKK